MQDAMTSMGRQTAHTAQLAAEAYHLKELYQITRRLAGKPITSQQARVKRPNWTFVHNCTRSTDQIARIL